MKYVKRFFLAATIMTVSGFAWWTGMNYAGYCHAEHRFLSDEEKINSAVRYVLAGYPPSIRRIVEENVNGSIKSAYEWYVPKNIIKYKDVGEFLKLNPDCCKISMVIGEGETASFINRITGYISAFVIVKYKVRYFDNDKTERYSDEGKAVAIKNCGMAW